MSLLTETLQQHSVPANTMHGGKYANNLRLNIKLTQRLDIIFYLEPVCELLKHNLDTTSDPRPELSHPEFKMFPES